MGPGHQQTQGLRLHRVRDPRGRPAGPGTDEQCHDRRQKHQGRSHCPQKQKKKYSKNILF